jgi:hypothetical protein
MSKGVFLLLFRGKKVIRSISSSFPGTLPDEGKIYLISMERRFQH